MVVGVSGRQASEQVALGYDAVLFATSKYALLPSTLKMESCSSAEAELPKMLFLAFTMTQLNECWVQAIGCWLKKCGF